jgi:hypothetical protein
METNAEELANRITQMNKDMREKKMKQREVSSKRREQVRL